ncbi:MAG TPA: cytochrome c oxidase subunit II [Steroidobacteraceae bacterium]|nr:cytochrome c oxidase subunit II [Steroidobacteraceae bacterium]
MLQALGVHAQHIELVWHTMLWVCGFMYLLVIAFLIHAIWRRRGDSDAEAPRRMSVALAGWIGLMVLGLFGLTLTSFLTDRALVHAASEPQVTLKITGYQWWWEIEYTNPDPSRQVRTANEIHLPVGAQVLAELGSNDVIHSLWVPSLNGKRDLIPGRPTEISLQPLRIGRYRGQCAEFCGLQHAKMALEVVVESQQDYDAWYERQLAAAPPASEARAARGQQVFFNTACNLCHAIAGTDAAATVGPDLSHVASRRMLAAGALPNDPEHLRRWLQNPQREKPGNHMPIVSLGRDDLDALIAYLGTLQ